MAIDPISPNPASTLSSVVSPLQDAGVASPQSESFSSVLESAMSPSQGGTALNASNVNTGMSPVNLNLLLTEWMVSLLSADNAAMAASNDSATNAFTGTSASAPSLPMNLPSVNTSPIGASNQQEIIATAIDKAAAETGLPATLIHAVAMQESNLNPNAVSPAGALGVMQLMPATAAALGVNNPFDPTENIQAGARYLAQLVQTFHGNMPLALAAYNAGPSAVETYQGVPPYPETQHYVQSVMERMNQGATQR